MRKMFIVVAGVAAGFALAAFIAEPAFATCIAC